MEHFRSVLETLVFIEQPRSNKQSVAVSDDIVFTEIVDTQHHFSNVTETLVFNELVINQGTYSKSASDVLNFVEVSYPRVYWSESFDLLSFAESTTTINPADTLNLTETVTFTLAKGVNDLLEFVEVASFNIIRTIAVAESLVFEESAVGYKIDTCLPTVQINNHQVTYTCGSDVITLPAPMFQNVEGLEFNMINDQSRGGDMIVFRDAAWPKTKTFNFRYTALKHEQREAVIQFTRKNIGKLVTMVDYEGRSFVGVIRNPDLSIAERGRGLHEIEIIFEEE